MSRGGVYKNNLIKFNKYNMSEDEDFLRHEDNKDECDIHNDHKGPIICEKCWEFEDDCECDEDSFFGGWDKEER